MRDASRHGMCLSDLPWNSDAFRSFSLCLWDLPGSSDCFLLHTAALAFRDTRRKGILKKFSVPSSAFRACVCVKSLVIGLTAVPKSQGCLGKLD